MDKPNFTSIIHHARVREAQLIGPQEVPHTQRLYKCECCNDSGIVQSWKLNRWGKTALDADLDAVMSLPVLCNRLSTCGEVEIQVFADKDRDENAPRTRTQNFKACENIGHYIRDGKLKRCQQSKLITSITRCSNIVSCSLSPIKARLTSMLYARQGARL